MTTELSIAAVTAVLKNLLGNGLVSAASSTGIGDVNITALPPDRLTTGTDERSQLNLFMYRVSPFSALTNRATFIRKEQAPAKGNSSPPLALELSYLLTACGGEEFHAEVLLGTAMQLLHQTPVLTPETIREALDSFSMKKGKVQSHPVKLAIAESQLADQLQQIRITPQFLSFEDMSKLWAALQARYRPSVCYQVSAVTIAGATDHQEVIAKRTA
jgi:Pvc16 N-terminal domain